MTSRRSTSVVTSLLAVAASLGVSGPLGWMNAEREVRERDEEATREARLATAEAKRARKRHARLRAAGIRPCRDGGFPGERCPADPNWSAEDCKAAHGAEGTLDVEEST